MCRSDFDETWDVWASWWGQGRCGDCGHVGRVLYEELGPERDEEYDEDLLALLLNDGVPELGAELDDIWNRSVSYLEHHSEHYADPGEVLASLPPRLLMSNRCANGAWRPDGGCPSGVEPGPTATT